MAFKVYDEVVLLTIHKVVLCRDVGRHAFAGNGSEGAWGIVVAELMYDELLYLDIAWH